MERKRKTAASISKELLEVESNPSECVINLPVEITMNICKREKKYTIVLIISVNSSPQLFANISLIPTDYLTCNAGVLDVALLLYKDFFFCFLNSLAI